MGKRKKRTTPEPQHVVLDLGLGPMGALDEDCPICRKLRAEGAPVQTYDAASGSVLEVAPGGPTGPSITVTLEPDALLAGALGGDGELSCELPAGCSVRDLLTFLCYTQPALRGMPSTSLGIERNGARLDRERALRDGDRLLLTAIRLGGLGGN